MNITLTSRSKAVAFFLVIVGSLLLSIAAAMKTNEFWSTPLIAVAVMFLFGQLPRSEKKDQFEWLYVLLCLGSGALLLFTPEQVYWTTPLTLGVILNVFGLPIIIGIVEDRLENKSKNEELS